MKNFHVRRGIPWMVMSFFLAVAACGGDPVGNDNGNGNGNGNGGGTTPVATIAVDVDDNFFTPPDIVVAPGATVTWTWVGGVDHNVNFASAAIADSGDKTTGMYQVAMPTMAGVYTYLCTIHGASMSGSVTVQ